MRVLLDTHVFLWAATDSKKLGRTAKEAILAADKVYISAASIWEIAIKARLGKIDGDPREMAGAIEESGFFPLAISPVHAAAVAQLPDHHRDPFDRLLIAQAITEPLVLLTADEALVQYSELIRRV